ncbi:MAG: hypothetical protein KDH17_22325 [Rhodocyclaceae bacterium]|nr:hypothetical protein [Rhodocyclaceae bacterium]
MKAFTRRVLPAMLSLVAGCAAVSFDGRYAVADGWRKGRVQETEGESRLAAKVADDCRKATDRAEASPIYATIRFEGSDHFRLRTVPLPVGEDWKKGDLVYLNVLDCKAPLHRRAS